MKNAAYLILAISLSGCLNITDIKSPPKIINAVSENQVYIEGRWRETSIVKKFKTTPRINSTAILCNRESLSCIEHEACLATRKDNNILPYALLYIQPTTYQISEWSNTIIKAHKEARAGDVELRISLADKSAEKSFRETSARGAEGANPNLVEHWILE